MLRKYGLNVKNTCTTKASALMYDPQSDSQRYKHTLYTGMKLFNSAIPAM